MLSRLAQWIQRLGIKPKFVVTFIGASLISMVGGSLVIKDTINAFQVTAHLKLAQTIANEEKQRLLSSILPDVALSRAIANDQTLQKWAEDEFNTELKQLAMDELQEYGELFSSGQFFYISNQSKHYYTNYSQGVFFPTKILYQLDLSQKNFNWYTEATETEKNYIINLDNDEYTGEVFVWVNTPVRKEGKVLGLAGTGFPITEFLSKFSSTDITKSVNMVVDAKGSILIQNSEFFLDRFSLDNDKLKSRRQLREAVGDDSQYAKLMKVFATLKERSVQGAAMSLPVDGQMWSVGISYLPALDWYNLSLLNAENLVNNQALETSFSIFLISIFTLLVLGLVLVDRTILSRIRELHQQVDQSYQHDRSIKPLSSGDELTQLSSAFSSMRQALQANVVELENKVAERTELLREKNVQLVELALTDPLTGLFNRRGMIERFIVELERGKRDNCYIAIAMVDIDDFKRINDRYGHDVGDEVIRSCGSIIVDSCRATDVVSRWGGEEFLIIIPNTGIEMLESILSRLLKNIRAYRVESEGGSVTYTVSLGAVIMDPAYVSMEKMINSADKAMYKVKNSGKDNYHLVQEGIG